MTDEVVHFLASPFPTNQGTQASVASFVRAADSVRERHVLLVPAESHGADPPGMRIERLPRMPMRSGTRSGPSFARLASDVATLALLRRAVRGRPVVAHNVEAAFLAATAAVPYVYVAHTSMTDELPMYGASATNAKRRLGAFLDRIAVVAARRSLAITPALARSLADRFDRSVRYLPQPWRASTPATPEERTDVRAELRLGDALVVLHAGNLDRYQGLPTIVEALRAVARERPVVFLIATGSDTAAFASAVDGLEVRFHPLADEADRRRVHAAADLVLLAREATSGLPIKMLEAFARGVPVVATRTSLAGLALHDELLVTEDDAGALAAGVPRALRSARDLVDSARLGLARNHTDREAGAVLSAAVRSMTAYPRS